MKKVAIFMLISALCVQSIELQAMATARSFYEKAREAASKSKSLQAAIKFVQRKPLTDEEKTILKKMTFTAAVIAIIAAVTGLTVAYTKDRLSNIEKLEPFNPKAVDLQLILKQAKSQGIAIEDKGLSAVIGNKGFISAIVRKDDADIRNFFCNTKNQMAASGQTFVTLDAAEFGLKLARNREYELGKQVADYIVNLIKSKDDLRFQSIADLKKRIIERHFTIQCP